MTTRAETPEEKRARLAEQAALVAAGVRFVWDERRSLYINLATGRAIPRIVVRRTLEEVLTGGKLKMQALSQSLIDGTITNAEWRAGMMQEIKVMHVASNAAARGGWAQMSQGDWGYTGSQIKKQYQFLENFAQQIADGTQKLDGRMMTRANLYAQAPRGSFESMTRRMMYNSGLTEERRVLGGSEHCEGCLAQAALDWQPINTLDPIGAEECRTNCQCEFEYR